MAKFKVGDRVRVKRDCSGAIKGEIYTLTMGSRNGNGMDALWAGGRCNCQYNWILVEGKRGRPKKEKPNQFIAIYDENDEDPVKEFKTRKELMAWLKEAYENEDIINSSIKVAEIKNWFDISTTFRLKKVKV